jgi:hypothetical protein
MDPRVLYELAGDLERETGEETEVWEVRGGRPAIDLINMFLDDAIHLGTVTLAFLEWRRRQRRESKESPRVKGVIWGPNDEILREVSEDED